MANGAVTFPDFAMLTARFHAPGNSSAASFKKGRTWNSLEGRGRLGSASYHALTY
jgi:hypothetical protein